ncbi:hypothetical protein Pmani_040263 [Petrolisthes manimaculis]|uniref:Fringe-like glycosyltransferase domain-containing protein n=1 Tax=Petrolisthes manimaculis TaxID=1843537 RepID=A0AAE1NC35_9EUCA|nr:hypothetical protein Pmani_040263 [Petrolisthes manimaculis]
MRVKVRTAMQQTVAVCGAVTLCVVVFQNFAPSATSETVQGHSSQALRYPRLSKAWPDRAPRSLASDYELTAGGEGNAVVGERKDASVEVEEEEGRGKERQEEERWRAMNTLVATATTRPETQLDDIFISVKTTRTFHRTRLDLLLKTWFQLAPKQVSRCLSLCCCCRVWSCRTVVLAVAVAG